MTPREVSCSSVADRPSAAYASLLCHSEQVIGISDGAANTFSAHNVEITREIKLHDAVLPINDQAEACVPCARGIASHALLNLVTSALVWLMTGAQLQVC